MRVRLLTVRKTKPQTSHSQPTVISRAERKAKHVEANKQLWNSAENPETFHFVDARNDVPLKSDFKPALKVLSRKPKTAQKNQLALGVHGGALAEDDDSEDEERRAIAASLADRQEKARIEREAKQKRYAEARERLFGSEVASSPTPVTERASPAAKQHDHRRDLRPSRRGGTQGGHDSSQPSSADQSPARQPTSTRQLFDPNQGSRPLTLRQNSSKADVTTTVSSRVIRETAPTRNPRGPDGSGRGGFGFASRGG